MPIRYNEYIAHLSCPECSGYWSVGDLPAGGHQALTCTHCGAGPMTDRLSRELTEAMRLLREAQVSLGGNSKLKARVDAFIRAHDEAPLLPGPGEG